MKINVYVQFCLGVRSRTDEVWSGRLAGSSCSPARPGGGARESLHDTGQKRGGANMEAVVPPPPLCPEPFRFSSSRGVEVPSRLLSSRLVIPVFWLVLCLVTGGKSSSVCLPLACCSLGECTNQTAGFSFPNTRCECQNVSGRFCKCQMFEMPFKTSPPCGSAPSLALRRDL